MAIKQAKIIAVTSAKGGTGKSTLALFLSALLAQEKKKVLLMDIDLYGNSICMMTASNPDKTLFTLVDDIKNNRYVGELEYVSEYSENLFILPAPKDPRQANKIGSKYLNIALSKLKTRYDYILLDMNHTLDDFNLVALDNSDMILYTITNDPLDLKNMRTIVSIFDDVEKENYKIILNETSKNAHSYFTKYDIRHMVHDNIDYILPRSFHIKNIDKYILDGKIAILDQKVQKNYPKGMEILQKIKVSIMEKE